MTSAASTMNAGAANLALEPADARRHRRGGRIIELRRYRIPAGQRALKAQRIDARVAIMDVPVDHADRVERHITSERELHGLADEYAQRSQTCGIPAVLAIRRTAEDLAELLTPAGP
jgi:hypothetical protein